MNTGVPERPRWLNTDPAAQGLQDGALTIRNISLRRNNKGVATSHTLINACVLLPYLPPATHLGNPVRDIVLPLAYSSSFTKCRRAYPTSDGGPSRLNCGSNQNAKAAAAHQQAPRLRDFQNPPRSILCQSCFASTKIVMGCDAKY